MNERFKLNLQGAFVRRTDLSYANLEGANLSDADCTNVNFRGANFKNTVLKGTILNGADMRDAANLTKEQIQTAIIDKNTLLPEYLSVIAQS